MAKGKKTINIKPENKGKFRALTKTKAGKDVSVKKIKQEEKSKDPAVRKEAVFADNARKFNHKGKKKG